MVSEVTQSEGRGQGDGIPQDFWYALHDRCFCNTCHVRIGTIYASIFTFIISLTGLLFIFFQRHQLDQLTNLNSIYEHYPLCGAFLLLMLSSSLALIGGLRRRKGLYIPHLVASIIFMYGTIYFIVQMVRKNAEKEEILYFEKAWLGGLIVGQIVLIYLLDVIYRDYKYLNRKIG